MLATASQPISMAEEIRRICQCKGGRLHWVVLSSLGLRSTDVIHSPRDLEVFRAICAHLGNAWTSIESDADITILVRPVESSLVTQIGRLKQGRRMVVYNDENDLDDLDLRTFEMATVCFFDHETRMIARLFDYGARPKGHNYLHVELNEFTDSSLALHASRIAALR